MVSINFGDFFLISTVFSPFFCSFLIFIFRKQRYLKEIFSILFSLALLASTLGNYFFSSTKHHTYLVFYEFLPHLNISFKAELTGIIFSVLVAFLWVLTTIYAISYMSFNDRNSEEKKSIFFSCFSGSIGCTMCIAFSHNLITLFVFYELLTLISYFLVIYNADSESYISGKHYLKVLLTSSSIFLLPALIITYALNGTLDFEIGGIFDHNISKTLFTIVFMFFSLGIAKTALIPFHSWLPKAMIAPTPVSALLHAVAIVKSGLYALIKIIVYTLGIQNIRNLVDFNFLMYIAGFTIIVSSCFAIKQTNLKKILAYSTISQLSYVIMIASLATNSAIKAAFLHLISHAFAKITLFFAVGIIQTCTAKKYLNELHGIGQLMPITITAFIIGGISIIGLPITIGFWSKFFIVHNAVHENNIFIPIIIVISTLLNALYFLPIIYNFFFRKPQITCSMAPVMMLSPLIITTTCTVILFFMIAKLLNMIDM